MSEAGPSNRAVTPPPRGVPNTNLQLTPEQVKRVELNRLRAKAKQREKETSNSTSASVPNANNKRPLAVTPATSNSPTRPTRAQEKGKLQRDSRLGKYFDYDLSKMVNTKGGFLVEEGDEGLDRQREIEMIREKQRAKQNAEPLYHMDPSKNPKCNECNSIDIEPSYRAVFRILVCKKCKDDIPEKYSLLTKTECKEDYLLTDSELKDEEIMPHLLKANPHHSTYSNMMLFCRLQVEKFAWEKWGSPEALDEEFAKRTAQKKKKKQDKFEQGLRELRKRTREGVWQRRQDAEHKHVYSRPNPGPDGIAKQVCHECGFTMEEVLQIGAALEVEQLDTYLFRSKELHKPYRARGAFGGQVISQALVSATRCVKPEYLVHCYFLLSVTNAVPILYYVTVLRNGRSYCTREVRAVQQGKTVFAMLCSFQIPEIAQPFTQYAMPTVQTPEASISEEAFLIHLAQQPGLSDAKREYYRGHAQARIRSPIDVRLPGKQTNPAGQAQMMYWLKTRENDAWEGSFQKCILAYVSDLHFLMAAASGLGLHRTGNDSKSLAMSSSLDHSISHDFNCADWMLYVVDSPAAGSGRGYVRGLMYSRDGKLLAAMTQEGVIRAGGTRPEKVVEPQSKL
ncbi:hypothetical protein PENSPDRAFT_567811 [Peniophora sp. CONT]|nr:hypothetical protein PENSPDRAFT_567811 [Peniophora sp. CONT]